MLFSEHCIFPVCLKQLQAAPHDYCMDVKIELKIRYWIQTFHEEAFARCGIEYHEHTPTFSRKAGLSPSDSCKYGKDKYIIPSQQSELC